MPVGQGRVQVGGVVRVDAEDAEIERALVLEQRAAQAEAVDGILLRTPDRHERAAAAQRVVAHSDRGVVADRSEARLRDDLDEDAAGAVVFRRELIARDADRSDLRLRRQRAAFEAVDADHGARAVDHDVGGGKAPHQHHRQMGVALNDELRREVGWSGYVEDIGFAFRGLTDSRVCERQRIRVEGCGKHPERQSDEILFHRQHALLCRSQRRRPPRPAVGGAGPPARPPGGAGGAPRPGPAAASESDRRR